MTGKLLLNFGTLLYQNKQDNLEIKKKPQTHLHPEMFEDLLMMSTKNTGFGFPKSVRSRTE